MSLQAGRILTGARRATSNQWRWLALLAVLTLSVAPWNVAVAQQTGLATLVGTISDPTGARIPGAQVAVVNVDMAFRTEVKTNAEGDYYVPYLRPGTYQITVDAAGFKRFVREGILLRTSEMPRVDIVLEIGATS